jgi:hypothetical protein
MGPTVLVPDGRVFAIGATGSTGLYIPPANPTDPGIWAVGPTLQVSVGGTLQTMFPMDAPAALLPNGKVFCAGSPGPVCSILAKDYNGPTNFFEYDYTTNKATPITSNAAGGTMTPPKCGAALLHRALPARADRAGAVRQRPAGHRGLHTLRRAAE